VWTLELPVEGLNEEDPEEAKGTLHARKVLQSWVRKPEEWESDSEEEDDGETDDPLSKQRETIERVVGGALDRFSVSRPPQVTPKNWSRLLGSLVTRMAEEISYRVTKIDNMGWYLNDTDFDLVTVDNPEELKKISTLPDFSKLKVQPVSDASGSAPVYLRGKLGGFDSSQHDGTTRQIPDFHVVVPLDMSHFSNYEAQKWSLFANGSDTGRNEETDKEWERVEKDEGVDCGEGVDGGKVPSSVAS
jgi:hypothetical protein